MEGKVRTEKKINLWESRSETFPELGGACLEVNGRGRMAPDPAFFLQLFFLSSGVTKRVGTGNSRVNLRGFSCHFVFFFFNFVHQETKLHFCFLLFLAMT